MIACGLMARHPELGRVKTRLAKEIGDEKALEVYLWLLSNAVKSICDLDAHKYLRVAFVSPPEEHESFCKRYDKFDKCRPQYGNNLGQRMKRALDELLEADNVDRVILIGADIPGITDATIVTAAEKLDDYDLILGPTYDGGYYLIGVKRMCGDLFANIEWGGKRVLERTLDVARQNNLSLYQLETMHDVDDLSDLKQFEPLVKIVK